MKRYIKRSLLALFGGTLLVSSLAGCAGRWHGGWQGGDSAQMQSRIVERIGSKLELDDMQKQKLAVLADKLRAQREAMRGGGDPREQFKSIIAGSRFDQAQAAKLVEDKTAALRAGSPEVIAAAADFFDHLNPGQQQKVRDFLARGRRFGPHG